MGGGSSLGVRTAFGRPGGGAGKGMGKGRGAGRPLAQAGGGLRPGGGGGGEACGGGPGGDGGTAAPVNQAWQAMLLRIRAKEARAAAGRNGADDCSGEAKKTRLS